MRVAGARQARARAAGAGGYLYDVAAADHWDGGCVCVTVFFLKKELLLERTSMIAHTHTNMDYMTNWLVYKNAQHC